MSVALSDSIPRIRRMTDADVDAVIEIERRAYPYPWTAGIFRDCLRVGYNAWVCVQDEQVRGYALMSSGGGEAHLLNICIDPNWQSRGLGRVMLEHVLRQAGREGADQIFLEVRPSNTAAINLYEDMGFIEVGRRKGYYPDEQGREDALILARYIPQDG